MAHDDMRRAPPGHNAPARATVACEQTQSGKNTGRFAQRSRPAVGIATSENRAYILTMAADKRPSGTHNPSQKTLQRWATEGGAEKGVHQKSPGAARAKKKQPAKAAKKK